MVIQIHHRLAGAVCIMMLMLVSAENAKPAEESMLSEWRDIAAKPESRKLLLWLRCLAKATLTGSSCNEKVNCAIPPFVGNTGVFVTLKKGKKVRGCYGAFSHNYTRTTDVLSDYLTGALTRDSRYDPLEKSELADTTIIVTITSQPWSVNDGASIDIRHCGVIISCENENRVYVPAEIKSISYIEKQMKDPQCELKSFTAITLQE